MFRSPWTTLIFSLLGFAVLALWIKPVENDTATTKENSPIEMQEASTKTSSEAVEISERTDKSQPSQNLAIEKTDSPKPSEPKEIKQLKAWDRLSQKLKDVIEESIANGDILEEERDKYAKYFLTLGKELSEQEKQEYDQSEDEFTTDELDVVYATPEQISDESNQDSESN